MNKFLILASLVLLGARQVPYPPNAGDVTVVPMERTPEPGEVKVQLIFPQNNELIPNLPYRGQLQVTGYPLRNDTEMERAKEIYNDPEGQSLHLFIDNEPYYSINEAVMNALDNYEEYFLQTANFIIKKVPPGMHVLRLMAVRSFNESLKMDNCFSTCIFYYQDKTPTLDFDPKKPFLTYNEPQGEYDAGPQPILLDFYITNCLLSADGFKVRFSIDGKVNRYLDRWVPYYIHGLKKGEHTIRLELLDPDNKPVPGVFNDVERTIVLK